MSDVTHRIYEIRLKLPRSEEAGEKEAVEIASRLEAELGAQRVTIREIDPATGKASLPFYAKAVA